MQLTPQARRFLGLASDSLVPVPTPQDTGPKKKKRGRRCTVYPAEVLQSIEIMRGDGMSWRQVAKVLGVKSLNSLQVTYNREKR